MINQNKCDIGLHNIMEDYRSGSWRRPTHKGLEDYNWKVCKTTQSLEDYHIKFRKTTTVLEPPLGDLPDQSHSW